MPQRLVQRLQGLIGLAAIAACVLVSFGVYNHSFSRPVSVDYTAPHAGLLLERGTEVRLHGIPVGRVDSVRSAGSGARLTLALDRKQSELIPAGVKARITPSTVVGAPHVELIAPTSTSSSSGTIRAGDVIAAHSSVPSVNDLFEQTVSLLRAVPVDKLNVTLSALATALDGRGGRLGKTLSALDHYARAINRHRDSLMRDITLSASVASQYADIAQPLLDLLQHSSVTGHTLVVRSGDLDKLLDGTNRLADAGQPLITELKSPLTKALRLLDPVTGLLAEYSPEFPCTLKAMERQALGNVSLGVKYPGAQAIMTLLPGQRGYRYPEDLPAFVNDRGPNCYSLPDLSTAQYPLPYRRYNDNSHANEDGAARLRLNPLSFFQPPLPAEQSVGSAP